MSRACSDTGERSLAHWSEAGREEMDAFYQVATLDYRELVRPYATTTLKSHHCP